MSKLGRTSQIQVILCTVALLFLSPLVMQPTLPAAKAADPPPDDPTFTPAPGFDFDGDGTDDLLLAQVIEDPAYPGIRQVEVFSGASGATTTLLFSPEPFDRFGDAATSAGDVNLDGADDLIIGAPHSPFFGTLGGSAYIYSGLDGSPLAHISGRSHWNLGQAAGGAGDINGDGFTEVLVSAFGYDQSLEHFGRVFAICPEYGTLVRTFNGDGAGATSDGFGYSVAGLGDLDADGFSEIAISAPLITHPVLDARGRISVFSGFGAFHTHTIHSPADATYTLFNTDPAIDMFAIGLAPARDLNEDGVPEILAISSTFNDAGDPLLQLDAFDLISGAVIQSLQLDALTHSGDTDLDYDVDGDDLNNVLGGIGDQVPSGRPYTGDTNDDGTVDLFDLNQVLEHYGIDAAVLNFTTQPNVVVAAKARFEWLYPPGTPPADDGDPSDPPTPDPQASCRPRANPPPSDCFGGIPGGDSPGWTPPWEPTPIYIAAPVPPDNDPPTIDPGPCEPDYEGDPCDCHLTCGCDRDGTGVPDEYERDSDCDGIVDALDVDSPGCLYHGDPACTLDDDGDGIPNQKDPDHPTCYSPPDHLIDLDIDSNNDNGFGSPDADDDEDALEHSTGIKVLIVNRSDSDGDSIPDYADGFGHFGPETDTGTLGDRFVPITLTVSNEADIANASIRFTSSEAPPSSTYRTQVDVPDIQSSYFRYIRGSGHLRLWTVDGTSVRTYDHFVGSNQLLPAIDFVGGRTLYLEAVNGSAVPVNVTATVTRLDGTSCSDTVKVLPFDSVTGLTAQEIEGFTIHYGSTTGTSGNDIILGTQEDDILVGGDGDDIIVAGYGDDHIDAGEGTNVVYAWHGSNTIILGSVDPLTSTQSADGDDSNLIILEDDGPFTAAQVLIVYYFLYGDNDPWMRIFLEVVNGKIEAVDGDGVLWTEADWDRRYNPATESYEFVIQLEFDLKTPFVAAAELMT